MKFQNIAKNILYQGSLEAKLLIDDSENEYNNELILPQRDNSLAVSKEQMKFPKAGVLDQSHKRGLALHFFANHELLAIELFSWALLKFDLTEQNAKTIIQTIEEEQKHLSLYISRMKDFNVYFGQYPLNGFLWNVITQAKDLDEFYAMMALTFEQANLDFMKYYMDIFSKLDDQRTYAILKIVYDDEIKHVARGVSYLNKGRNRGSLWEYYQSLLPEKITPSRAKGIVFDEQARKAAGLDKDFIASLKNYFDHFKVTNRKEWKKDIS